MKAIKTERDNFQNSLNEAETNLTQRETELQTRTTERNNARNEARQARTELEAIMAESHNFRNGGGANNRNNEELIKLMERLYEVVISIAIYMDCYATCSQDVCRLQGQLERTKNELREAKRCLQ